MRSEQKKILYKRSKFGRHCLLTQGALLRQYIGAKIHIFHSYVHFYITSSPFPQLSPSSSLSIFLNIFLFVEDKKNNQKEERTVRCVLHGGNGNTLNKEQDQY
jgi:hypothetical protein